MSAVSPTLCLLGFDVSPSKVGIGVVRDDDGSPVQAIYRDVAGPSDIRDTLSELAWGMVGYEPVLAYIERPDRRTTAGQLEAGIAIGMWMYALSRRWPHMPVQLVSVDSWRSRVGIARAPNELSAYRRRQWYKARAVDEAQALGFTLPEVGVRMLRPSDDAAEGALLARAAWLDLEEGLVAKRVNRGYDWMIEEIRGHGRILRLDERRTR